MTEQEWFSCSKPDELQRFVRNKASQRKLLLYACACCRSVWELLPEARSRRTVEVVERFADGLSARTEVENARVSSWGVVRMLHEREGRSVSREVAAAAAWAAEAAVCGSSSILAEAAAGAQRAARRRRGNPSGAKKELRRQSRLARHIFGNPFVSHTMSHRWPATVVSLAMALYAGEAVAFALHDALREAGHPDLAEHFMDEHHPKGCWALDVILDKQ